MLPMPREKDRMPAVHAAVLPDNKVLIVNDSSNGNDVTAEGKIMAVLMLRVTMSSTTPPS